MEPLIDDPNIDDNEILYRRISPLQIKPEGSSFRPSTAAFTTSQMSVYLASLVSPSQVLSNYREFSLISFTAETVRRFGCIIARQQDDQDPAHVLVCPRENPNGRISKRIARDLISCSSWVELKALNGL